MRSAGVNAAVLIPVSTDTDPSDVFEPCVAAARLHPSKFAVMARVDPMDSDQVQFLDRWPSVHGVMGIRLSFHKQVGPEDALGIDKAGWLWPELERRRLPVMINAAGSAAEIAAIAAAFPKLRIAVDHLGFEGMDIDVLYDDLTAHIGPILELSSIPNVCVKASGLPAVISEDYPFQNLRECLRLVVKAFGPNRVFWGSNLSRSPIAYAQVVRFFLTELDFLSGGELADVMGRGLVRWLRWEDLIRES
jgi:predicted TIM-barrel fold metal-dependent hydrolase